MKTASKHIAGLLAVGLAFFCSACEASEPSMVDRIGLVTVDIVEPEQIVDPGNALGDRPNSPMVRVIFSSTTDYQQMAIEQNYTMIDRIGFCSGNSVDLKRRINGFDDVYDQSAMVSPNRPGGFGTSRKSSGDRIAYHVYFFPKLMYGKADEDSWKRLGMPPYDLVQKPDEICLQVIGGKLDAHHNFETNAMRIPKKMLLDAFRRAHLACDSSKVYCERTR